MDLGLADRVYIVTGGTSGLGRATAAALVADGARVVVSARTPDRVTSTVADLGGAPHATGVAVDNADPAGAARLVQTAVDTYGVLHGACISVGGPPPGSALDVTDEQWSAAFASVFLGAIRLARTVATAMSGDGALAFVLSSSVKQPIPGLAISNGLRPGLAMVAKTLADELGPRGIRVMSLLPRVNCRCSGRVATPHLKAHSPMSRVAAGLPPETPALRRAGRVRPGRPVRTVARGVVPHGMCDSGRRRGDRTL